MNGYGIYVWLSFINLLSYLFYVFKNKKTLKKLEKDFIKETQNLSQQEFEDLKEQKVIREILVSHPRT